MKSFVQKIITFLGLFFLLSNHSFAQCQCTDCPVNLPDVLNTPFNGSLSVCGATNNVLGVNNTLQQVCINIEHSWVGDLDISLTSPDGTTVVLFADGNNQFNGGNGSSPFGNSDGDFDVCFVLSTATATGNFGVADAGTGSICSAGTTASVNCNGPASGPCYTGNWYPWNQTCGGIGLNAFNNGTGTVNGTWTVTIRDNAGGNSGTLNNFTLVFANNAGINCISSNGVTAGNDQTVCINTASFNLSGVNPTGGTWSGTGITNTTSGTFNPATAGIGTHNLTYTMGCSQDIKTVTVVGPTVSINPANPQICAGSNATLTANASASGTVNNTQTFNSTGGPWNIPDDDLTTGITSTIPVSGMSGTVSATSIGKVCVNIDHTWNADVDLYLQCPGGTRIKLLDDIGSSSNNFTNTCFVTGGTALSSGSAPFTGNFAPLQAFSGLNGCNLNGNWSIVAYDDVSGDVGSIQSWNIELNSSIANSVVSYSWSPSTNLSSTTATAPVANPTSTTTYTVSVTDAAGCINTATVLVTVNQTPAVTGLSNQSVCASNTFAGLALTSNPAGATFSWTNSNPSIGLAANGSGNIPSFTATNATAGPITSTISVTPTLNGCPGTPSTFTITVNPVPNASVTASQSICNGQSITLTGSGVGISNYSWSTGQTGANINVSPTSTTTYSLVATSVTTCKRNLTTTVTVNPLPTVTINGTSSICPGSSSTLTAGGASTYSWASSLGNSNPLTVSPTSSTTYTVYGTDANNCTSSSTFNVNVNNNLTFTLNGPNEICIGENATITASGANNYSWNNGNTNASITIQPTSTTTYTVNGSDLNGCSGDTTFTLIVNQQPILNTTNDTSICVGETISLNVSGAGSYSWSNGNTSASINVSPANLTVYTVIGTDANGCTDTAQINLNVLPLPNVSISGNTTLCTGSSSTLTASGANSYSWSTGDTASSIIISPANSQTYTLTGINGSCTDTAMISINVVNASPLTLTAVNNSICIGESTQLNISGGTTYNWSTGETGNQINVSPTSTTIYSVTSQSTQGCLQSEAIQINVNSLPAINISGNNSICIGTSTTLTASGGISYTWDNGATDSVITVFPTNNTTYIVTGTDANGCVNTQNVNVSLLSLPTISFNGDSIICLGESTSLIANGLNSFNWSNGNTSATINVSPTSNTAYIVNGADANGCSNSATINVIVNNQPLLNISQDIFTCIGGSATLVISGASNYSWFPSNGLNTTSGSSVIASPVNTTTYSVIGTDVNGCSDTTSVNFNIQANLSMTSSPASSVCAGNSLNLFANGASNYTWLPNNGTLDNYSSSQVVSTPINTITYTVIGSAGTCEDTVYIPVTVNTLPVANAGNDQTLCEGNSVNIGNTATFGYNYTWSNSAGLNDTTISNPIFNGNISGIYILTVTDANGCIDEDSVLITVNSKPVAQFTSNNICIGNTAIFIDQSNISSGSISSYSWDFGDGNTYIGLGAAHNYSTCGFFPVTLITESDLNCFDTANIVLGVYCNPQADFTMTDTSICAGETVSFTNNSIDPLGSVLNYFWNFDLNSNEGTSSNQNEIHQYNTAYPQLAIVQLIVSNATGCADTTEKYINISDSPVADFYANDVCLGDTSHFINQTVATNLNGLTYNWYLGNSSGTTSTQQNPSILYSSAQNYTVTLIALGGNGCSDTATQLIIVNSLPAPSFTVNSTCFGLPALYTNTTLNTNNLNFNWDFESDGVIDNTQFEPSNAFNNVGNYTTSLIAENFITQCRDTFANSISIYRNPIANFTQDTSQGCEPLCVGFTDASIAQEPTAQLKQWTWTFSNGNEYYVQNPAKCFDAGVYNTRLKVVDTYGCTDSIIKLSNVTSNGLPIADFSFNPYKPTELNSTVYFYDESIGNVTNWFWNFGDKKDSLGSIDKNTIYTYNDTGNFCITLTTISGWGCFDSITKCIYVEPEFAVYIPNAFSPNNNGINEIFKIEGRGIDLSKEFSMLIYNRWGQLIYESKNINEGWNGKIKNDKIPADSYVYKIRLFDMFGREKEYNGVINLLR